MRQYPRIRRCRLYPLEEHGEAFRGYISGKRRYFYGLRVHLVVTGAGEPVEFSLAAGSEAAISVFKAFQLDLPEGSSGDYEDVQPAIVAEGARRRFVAIEVIGVSPLALKERKLVPGPSWRIGVKGNPCGSGSSSVV